MTSDPTDPKTTGDDPTDAPNEGVSSTEPAEGADDLPAGGAGSPDPAPGAL